MNSGLVSLIEESASLLSSHKGVRNFHVIEGLQTRPAVLADQMVKFGWKITLLEGFGYRFERDNKAIELLFEPTAEELSFAFSVSSLISAGLLPELPAEQPFTLVETIMANDVIIPKNLLSTVEILKTLIIDNLGNSLAEWQIERFLTDNPQIIDAAIKLGKSEIL